jgi:hypothetical protein
VLAPDAFDAGAVEMVRRLGTKKGSARTHYYPFAMATYNVMPPPEKLEKSLGEKREVRFTGVGLSLGAEVDVSDAGDWAKGLGAEATADPTAVEREVRLQVAERQAAHEDRNAARQLTPQERREKAMRKMFEESHGASDTLCCVYRVERLDSRLNEYKVLLNAEENHLTGAGFKTESFALIIVEGARKAIVRFNKLMLRRMDWALQQQLPGPDDPDDPHSVEACQRAARVMGKVWAGSDYSSDRPKGCFWNEETNSSGVFVFFLLCSFRLPLLS